MSENVLQHVGNLIRSARPILSDEEAAAGPATPAANLEAESRPSSQHGGADREDMNPDYAGDEDGPSDMPPIGVDADTIAFCARLDHSDTDNGRRVITHFGGDLCVLDQEDAQKNSFVVWTGTHWDMASGNHAAMRLAQKIGGLIALEADALTFLPYEERALAAGAKAAQDLERLVQKPRKDWSEAEAADAQRYEDQVRAAKDARAALDNRQKARRKFAVSSKNKARLEAMLACAAPHLTRKPDAFNADAMLLATRGHTLRFHRTEDLECPDPEVTRHIGAVEAIEGHRREDMITKVVPVDYDPDATCPMWDAFLEEFLPVDSVRRCVQVFSGLGLTGIPIQRLLFHEGSGANGKSVFLETLTRVVGAIGVGLPAESVIGEGPRGSGQANPDLVRLYGARMVRVLELPAEQPIQEALIKKLTGGEKIPVRALFKGYFEFQPVFKAHMSGNGYPKIEGTDNGIWRRMTVIHWPVTLAEERQRNFEDVVSEFAPEYAGILNWLIEGAKIFLGEGLVIPDEVRSATQDYRDEMDPIGQFVADCVVPEPGGHVTARDMYVAYKDWCAANAKKAAFESRFGRVMKTKLVREDSRIRKYLDCRLSNVPVNPDRMPRNPQWEPD